MLSRRALCALAFLALVVAGCRLGVRAEVDVARDGSGTAALVVSLDAELLAALDELDVDPTAELTAAAADTTGWELRREVTDDEALVLTLRTERDAAEGLTDAFRELTTGLTATDPALAVDLDLDLDPDGAARLDGSVQLRTPPGPGVITDEAAATELAELAEDTVDAALVVSLPGPVTASDADVVEGSTLTWRVPPGEARTVTASAAAPTGWSSDVIAAVVAAVLVLLSGGVVAWIVVRRRRRG